MPDDNNSVVQPQPTSPAPAQRQAHSALDSDPGTINDIEDEDPDMDMAVSYFEQANNPELHGNSPQGDGDGGDPTDDQTPEGQQPQGDPQGGAPQAQPDPNAVVAGQQPQPQPTVQPVQPQQPQPQAAGVPTPQVPVVNPSDAFRVLHDQIEQGRDKIAGVLAGQTYQLSHQELEQIRDEPEKILPTLMARVHLNTLQGVMRHVAQQLPTVVSSMMETRMAHQRLEDQFYGAWPQLDRGKHDTTVRQMAAMYRSMNPAASVEDMIRTVGAQVVTALNLPMQTAQPQTRQVVRRQAQAPAFTPAAPAQTGAPAASNGRVPGEWERYAAYIAMDDAGRFENS